MTNNAAKGMLALQLRESIIYPHYGGILSMPIANPLPEFENLAQVSN